MAKHFSLKGDGWTERELQLVGLIATMQGKQVQAAAGLIQIALKHGNLPEEEIPTAAERWTAECLRSAAAELGLELVEEGA